MISFLFWGLAAVLLWAPVPLGSDRPWAAALLAVMLGILLLGPVLAGRPLLPAMIAQALRWPAILLALVGAWAVCQLMPMGGSLAHPLWHEAAAALPGQDLTPSIALNREAGWWGLLRWLLAPAGFLLAVLVATDRILAWRLVWVIFGTSLAFALYGLINKLSGAEYILFIAKWAHLGDLTATFANRNHAASFIAIGMLCGLALAWRAWRHRSRQRSGDAIRRREQAIHDALMVGTAGLATLGPMLAALLLTHSRAGATCLLLGVAVLGLCLTLLRGRQKRPWPALAALLLALLGGLMLGGGGLSDRLETSVVLADATPRLNTYQVTAEAIAAAPLVGYGLGSFDYVFRLFRDSRVEGWYHRAHQDYLEMALDLGLPAFLLLLAAYGIVAVRCVQGVMTRRRDYLLPALALAAGTVAAVHSAVDYPLQIPAISLTLAVLAGIGFAQSFGSESFGSEPFGADAQDQEAAGRANDDSNASRRSRSSGRSRS